MFRAWIINLKIGKGENVKRKMRNSKKKAEARNADLLDWLLAIDAT